MVGGGGGREERTINMSISTEDSGMPTTKLVMFKDENLLCV